MNLSNQEYEALKVVDAEYSVVSEGHQVPQPIVHLFCRDASRNKRRIDVEGFRPYFMMPYHEFVERTSDVINDRHVHAVEADLSDYSEMKSGNAEFDGPESIASWLTDEGSCQVYHKSDTFDALDETKLAKVYTVEPAHVGKIRDHWERTWEADIPFERRFLISSGITNGIEVPTNATSVRYENWDGHSDSDGHIREIRPADPPDVHPRMLVTDIEVATHGGGFPDPIKARNEITAITAYDNYEDEYAGWILESDKWDDTDRAFEEEINESLDMEIDQMEVFDHEGAMVEDYHNWVLERDFDIVTGWNSNWFDYPYIINRSYEVSAYSIRDWDKFGNPGAWYAGDDNDTIRMNVGGLTTFDMLDAYKKTQYRELRSYSLEDVAQAELGMGKETLGEDLDDAWHYHPVDFMIYNVRDVQAVAQIEESSALLDLYDNMRQVTGALYETCNHNGPMLDTLFLRQAYEEGVALTTNYEPDQGDYHGAHVFDPVPGKHDTVVYPDLASLYPYILWTLNISPETMYESREAYQADGYTDDDVFTAYIDDREWKVMSSGETVEPGKIDKDTYKGIHDETGSRKKRESQGFDGIFDPLQDDHPTSKSEIYFVKPDVKEGFIRKTVDLLVDLKYQYKGQKEMYAAVKRVTNSIYGVLGDSSSGGVGFRLFDWKLAESITLGGQMVIQFTAKQYVDLIDEYSQEAGYEPNTYLVGGDTDSVMTAIPQAPDYETALEWARRASEELRDKYDVFMEDEFDVVRGEDEHKMDVEIESLASSLFFMRDWDRDDEVAVKKRYAQHEIWEETDGWLDTEDPPEDESDDGYENAPDDPEDRSDIKYWSDVSLDGYEDGPLSEWGDPANHVDITGFEYVRSDSAIITVEAQEEVLTYILLADDLSDRLYEYLSDLRDDIINGSVPIEKLGRPKGIGNPLDDYGWKTTEELRSDTNYTVTETDEEWGGRYVAKSGPTYRGRKYAVDHFDWEDGDQKKCMRLYVDRVRGGEYPAAYEYDDFPRGDRPDPLEVGQDVDAITVEYIDRVPDEFIFDREKMMDKELKDKIEPIIRTIGEEWDGIVGQGRQVGLDAF